MSLSEELRTRLLPKLTQLYGSDDEACLERVTELAEQGRGPAEARQTQLWSERDVVLIAYGDQIRSSDRSSLQTLKTFLLDNQLNDAVNTVHILPFFPYSSDDGFSIIDYRQVDPQLGTWQDVDEIGQSFNLMFDLVLNHCSTSNEWFQKYLQGQEPYDRYFVEVDPQTDLSAVMRPRNSPLLTPFAATRGTRHVWTTFSDDQVDLNFANPDVLIEMLDVLLFYVRQGARIIRLDAIAYLWKTIGTSCIHLPQTHTLVKLMRDLLDLLAPGTLLLTETNVPHQENVSYFGDGDEAHMVYQFSLAPLVLDAFLTADGGPLTQWLSNLEQTSEGMTFFNFTASHDGVGVRPLEGLVAQPQIDRLVEELRRRGGRVSTKRNPDGTESPYELNVSYFSALGFPEGLPAAGHVRRFLSSQGLMLALRGIPGIYFHSLVATANDVSGVEQTGIARSINRRKFESGELQRILAERGSDQQLVFDGYRKMLATRIRQPAFHPDAPQTVVDLGHRAVIAFVRTSLDRRQNILVLVNLSGEQVPVDLTRFRNLRIECDLLSSRPLSSQGFVLDSYGIAWLSHRTMDL
jgi:sucrose phosphorylase